MIVRVLYLAIGFMLGSLAYSTAFDPVRFQNSALLFGAEAYRLGCTEAGATYEECTRKGSIFLKRITPDSSGHSSIER